MVISDSIENGVLKSVFRSSNLWVRESFSAMATAVQRKDFVDPLAALTTDRGNLCDAKDYDIIGPTQVDHRGADIRTVC